MVLIGRLSFAAAQQPPWWRLDMAMRQKASDVGLLMPGARGDPFGCFGSHQNQTQADDTLVNGTRIEARDGLSMPPFALTNVVCAMNKNTSEDSLAPFTIFTLVVLSKTYSICNIKEKYLVNPQ